MAVVAYKKTSITGGTINSLDGVDGATLNVDDFGFVFASDDAQYDYEVRESGATPDGLNIVIPVINPGDMRWHIKLRTADSLANVALTHADVLLTNADVVSTNDDATQTALDVIATAKDRVQTGLDAAATGQDAIDTAEDRVQTGFDAIATAADRVQTGLDVVSTAADVITATAQAAALISTSTTSLLIEIASKTFTTQANKKFTAGMFVLAVSDANPINYMHGQVTSYATTTLIINVTNVGGSGTLADWTISVSGSQGAAGEKGDTGTGITEQAVGWTGTGGTTPKTLTVNTDMTLTGYATAAEITTGTEAAKAIAPDQLALTKYNGDWSFWGIKNLRLIDVHPGDATRVIVNPSAYNIPLLIGEHWHVMTSAVDVDVADDLDTGSVAAATDYYIYACTDGTTLSFKVSANATNPTGFDAVHSRKIGGFHTLCVAVGTISGHTLTGYAQKDILPASIWDLKHRAKNLVNVGLVYDSKIQKWVDIYLASGTGANTTSVNGGTISDTRNWMDFVDDGLAVGKRLLTDTEFTSIATGSNEETNITGSADPGTTSGHVDTAGRRMISNIGCEDCCGVVWQWLQDQAYYYYGTTGYYGNLPGGKGSTYTNFAADPGATEVDNSDSGGDTKLLAGGHWANAAVCGSRSRYSYCSRWYTFANVGARFVSEPL